MNRKKNYLSKTRVSLTITGLGQSFFAHPCERRPALSTSGAWRSVILFTAGLGGKKRRSTKLRGKDSEGAEGRPEGVERMGRRTDGDE